MITKSVNVSGGKVSTFATRECRTASSHRRGRRGSVRSARVIGAPSAIANGTTIASTMCWTMCTDSNVSSYTARPETVARVALPMPTPTNDRVRPTGQWSPRRCSRTTPQR